MAVRAEDGVPGTDEQQGGPTENAENDVLKGLPKWCRILYALIEEAAGGAEEGPKPKKRPVEGDHDA